MSINSSNLFEISLIFSKLGFNLSHQAFARLSACDKLFAFLRSSIILLLLSQIAFTFSEILFTISCNDLEAFQEFYSNPYYHKPEQYIDSLLKIDYNSVFVQVAHYYKNDFNEYIKQYGLRNTINTTDSLNKKTVYKWVKNNSELKRKYIPSNYRYSTKSVAVLKQTKSLPLMGFRSVLPYTGIAVKKGYKVKW